MHLICKTELLQFPLVAERLTKKAFRSFFDWVGADLSATVGLCPGIKCGAFYRGSRGIPPSQAVCAEAQTLLACILLSPCGERCTRLLPIKENIDLLSRYADK